MPAGTTQLPRCSGTPVRAAALFDLFPHKKRLSIGDVCGADVGGLRRYAGWVRYAQGGWLTAEGRKRREQVRLEAARRFEEGAAGCGDRR
jgi:hypothetical protein